MSTTAFARRRTATGIALSASLLGLVVPSPSAGATPPGSPLQDRCSIPAPAFDRTDYSVDGEAVEATIGDFNADGHPDVATVTTGLGGYTAVVLRGSGQGGFSAKSTYDLDPDPQAVAAADFNSDGYDDLAVSRFDLSHSRALLVGKNDTAGGFDFAGYAGNTAASLVTGDFDDDGKLDVASPDGAGLQLWPGNGDGTVGAERYYPTGALAWRISAGDFNSDGLLDAVLANRDADSVSVLLQTAGGFAPAITMPVADTPIGITVGDFNGDGNSDIAVANNYTGFSQYGVVDILLGDGDGGFIAESPPEVGDNQDVVSGDFNHDGKIDLAVLKEYDNEVLVLTGRGDGSFASPVAFALGHDPRSISAADVNEDGLDDLVSANYHDGSVSVLLNTSRPTNDDPTAEGDSYTAPANGVLSVPAPGVLGNDSDADCDPLSASVATGPSHGLVDLDPDGSFTYTPTSGYVGADSFTYRAEDGLGGTTEATVSLNVSTVEAVDDAVTDTEAGAPSPLDVLANDTDSDPAGGALTITAVTQPAYGSVVITGAGSGLTYTPPDDVAGPDPFTYSVTNGVGRTDSATVTVTVEPSRGCAAASFAARRQAGQLDVPSVTGTGDFDGDGDVDLASISSDTRTFQIAYNDGTGDFPDTPNETLGINDPRGGSIGDLDSDGRLDIVLAARTEGALGVMYGADGGFQGPALRYYTPPAFNRLEPTLTAIGDVDEDGDTDLIGADAFRMVVMKGDGARGFTAQPVFSGPYDTDQISLADIDGDGHLDLVGHDDGTDRVWVMPGDGHAAFGSVTFAAVGDRPRDHITADFDGDGVLDLATVNARDLSVLYGDGAGGFAPAILLPVGTGGGAGPVVAADVNADGRPDLVTVQFDSGAVSVFLSRGAGGFAPRQLIGTGVQPGWAVAASDFNGDGSMDLVVVTDENWFDSTPSELWVLDNQCPARVRPIAVADTYVTAEDTDLDVHTPGLLGNDTYAGAVTVSEQAGPSHGNLDLDPAGSFTYTPDEDFTGRDSFTYTVDDGHGGTDTATVNVTVTPSTDDPDAVDDDAIVPQDAAATTVDVLANDTDADSDPLEVTATTQGTHGTVAITNAGADLTYTPAAGFFGTDAFTYTISDGHGGTDTATVDVTVLSATSPQSISFISTPPAQPTIGDTYQVLASATSGLTVTFAVGAGTTNAACTMIGRSVRLNRVGTCVIAANQAGSTGYDPAPTVTQMIAVRRVQEVLIKSDPPRFRQAGKTYEASASDRATPGTPITFELGPATTNVACTVTTGGLVRFVRAGTCSIIAKRPSNQTYHPAQDEQSFQVG